VQTLGKQISHFTGDPRFETAPSMGVILELALLFVIRNYRDLTAL
jgi:hypothetical protein